VKDRCAPDDPVRVIAVLLPVPDELLADDAFIRDYLAERLRRFVEQERGRQQ
jgi:hypothetical protein